MKEFHRTVFLLSLFLISGCSTKVITQNEKILSIDSAKVIEADNNVNDLLEESKSVLLGIDVLEQRNFDVLRNKRVGLITNQTGVNKDLKSTIDILNDSENVDLVALFGPEHGIRGEVEGGDKIDFYIDKKTGLPVYSLYGNTSKPTSKMLEGIDVLVYDIQDIGVRSYTFISTMGMSIEAASENKIEYVILDRPNPLGGEKVEGNIVENGFDSFISQFPIPYVYGLTCAELASLLIGENLISVSDDFKVKIIPMKHWKRSMTWEDTQLNWVPTSPHIPNSFTSYFYPMTGILGELRSVISIGVGYTLPFQIVGAEWINGQSLSQFLNDFNIPGLYFRPISYKPFYAYGEGRILQGVQIHINDYDKVNLTNTQFYIIAALKTLYPDMDIFSKATRNEISMFNKGIGTDKIIKKFENNEEINEIINYLNKDSRKFQIKSKPYHLYAL